MIKIIALDIGGVIAYQDFSRLSEQEKFLLQMYREEISISNFSQLELIKIKKEIDEKIKDIYTKLYVLMDDSLDTLKYIKQKNFIPSIWTNNRPAIYSWLKQSGILMYISSTQICNSCDMPRGINKPNPRFYKIALRQLSSKPSQVLFVDDDYRNVSVARKLGIKCIHYSNQEQRLKETIIQKIKVLERK